jgi:hypothetical protein
MTDDALKKAFAQDIVFLRLRRVAARRRARRRPADRRHARAAGSRPASSRAACGSPPRRSWTSSGWCSWVRSGASSSGLLNQHGPIAVGLSGEDANLFGARRRGAVVDGEQESTSGWSATSSRSTPRPCRTSSPPAGSPSSRRSHPTSTATVRSSTSTPTPPPPPSPSPYGRPQARRPHRRRGRVRRLARPSTACSAGSPSPRRRRSC